MPEPPVEFHGWFTFWIYLLYIALGLFSVVALVVTVKGWQEIRIMLSRLHDSSAEDESTDG